MDGTRYWQRQNNIARDKQAMWDAEAAVRNWRSGQNPSGFPKLRSYLWGKTSFGNWESFTITGWGRTFHPALTKEEYNEMKVAFLFTDPGKADDWKIKSDWL